MDECRKQFEEWCGMMDAVSEPKFAWDAWQASWNRRAEMQIPEGWKDVAVELPKDGQLIIGCNKDRDTWTEIWDSEEPIGGTRWWIAAPEVK